eukprot:5146197-Pyramimonas_sp.AAC.1
MNTSIIVAHSPWCMLDEIPVKARSLLEKLRVTRSETRVALGSSELDRCAEITGRRLACDIAARKVDECVQEEIAHHHVYGTCRGTCACDVSKRRAKVTPERVASKRARVTE